MRSEALGVVIPRAGDHEGKAGGLNKPSIIYYHIPLDRKRHPNGRRDEPFRIQRSPFDHDPAGLDEKTGARGMERDTPQRRAIRDVLAGAGRPMSPEEILVAGRQLVRGLGIATVYRNLKLLTEKRWLSPVALPGEPTRYEVSGKPHHHHFVCRQCDRAFEIDDCPSNFGMKVPSGFRVDSHEVVLYGLCAACTN